MSHHHRLHSPGQSGHHPHQLHRKNVPPAKTQRDELGELCPLPGEPLPQNQQRHGWRQAVGRETGAQQSFGWNLPSPGQLGQRLPGAHRPARANAVSAPDPRDISRACRTHRLASSVLSHLHCRRDNRCHHHRLQFVLVHLRLLAFLAASELRSLLHPERRRKLEFSEQEPQPGQSLDLQLVFTVAVFP